MARRSEHLKHHLGRELSVKPRRTGYVHRDIIAVCDGVGVTEGGEVVRNLACFAATNTSYVWVTVDPAHLLLTLLERCTEVEAFNYQIVASRDEVTDGPFTESSRLTRFGFKCKCKRYRNVEFKCGCGFPSTRKGAMHMVWSPGDMTRNPASLMDGYTHSHLLTWARDVRDWCKEQNIPLPTSLSGIAASLTRDARFWPDARGRVPTATNERVRAWLPGVYSELRAEPAHTYNAIAIDQRTAYHRAAQEVPTPDPTTLFARGYYVSPESSPIWATPGDTLYERTINQPGVVFVSYSARPVRKHETRPPCVQSGRGRCALWTVEVPYLESQGVTIEGIIAAWTSAEPDHGIARYGEWSQTQITTASEQRKRWLKPTLHSLYGLMAMRTRQISIGNYRGNGGTPAKFILGAGHEFVAQRHDLPPLPSATTNVATLGVLQAEIRRRSFVMANHLSMEGLSVLHIHADGIHVEGNAMPLITDAWSIEPRTSLIYLDRVSWLSDQGDTLPGRDERERVATRRHNARLIRHLQSRKHRSEHPASR